VANDAAIDAVAERLRRAERVTVLTGAGVSAASGVPTFRGPDGLWRSFRPEELATADAFRRNPLLVWEWYDWRRRRIAACLPNRAHAVLAAWSRRWPGCRVVTQNVDGLHERAGLAEVLRLHGSIWELSCWRSCAGSPGAWRDERVPIEPLPPRCASCGDLARPAVVWFGEALDPDVMARAAAAADCDVFIAAGTSAVVFPAAGLIAQARQSGAFTVEVNPDSTPATRRVHVALQAPAEAVFDALERRLQTA
jgi:NAD-dependent deacetylase